ncbi:MAG TPA: luciferase family protein [Clostridia bacterium]|nr:luciferase family protein [Clostridia bacterium]
MTKRAARIANVRRPLPKVSEEMQQLSEFLRQELLTWPGVTARPMFGMTAVYRGNEIFGALPRTRAMETSRSVSFKLHRQTREVAEALERDSRIVQQEGTMVSWVSMELESERDIPDALQWFGRAYEQARGRRKAS